MRRVARVCTRTVLLIDDALKGKLNRLCQLPPTLLLRKTVKKKAMSLRGASPSTCNSVCTVRKCNRIRILDLAIQTEVYRNELMIGTLLASWRCLFAAGRLQSSQWPVLLINFPNRRGVHQVHKSQMTASCSRFSREFGIIVLSSVCGACAFQHVNFEAVGFTREAV